MNQTKFKKHAVLALIVVAVIGIGAFVFTRGSSEEAPSETQAQLKKRKISEPVNIISVSERPYITIRPDLDGRHLHISIDSIKKAATEMEYELEYTSGSLQQGLFGSLDISKLPATTKQLMGTCSAGGACSYHTEVTGGSLVTRFAGEENYALKTQWRYFENVDKQTEFASTDAKFQVASDSLTTAKVVIIADSSGFPGEVEGTVLSAPYSLQTSSAMTGKATVSIRLNEDQENAVLLGYNGSEWVSFSGTVADKTLTAEADLLEAYIAVAP